MRLRCLIVGVSCALFVGGAAQSVHFTKPTDGSCVGTFVQICFQANATPAFRLTVADDMGHVLFNQFYASNPGEVCIGYEPFALGVPDGFHTVIVTLLKNGVKYQDTLPLKIDSTPPNPAVTSPLGGAFVSGLVPITGKVNDNLTDGLETWLVFVDGQAIAAGTGDDVLAYWNSVGLIGGSSHSISIVATDCSGNTNTSDPINVTLAATITGTLELDTWVGPFEWVWMNVVVRDGDLELDNQIVPVDSTGRFTVLTEAIGSHKVIFKPSHWLSVKEDNIDLYGVVERDLYFPVNGDCSLSNLIDIIDINMIFVNFGQPDIDSDLNGSGHTDVYDLNMVFINFSLAGEE